MLQIFLHTFGGALDIATLATVIGMSWLLLVLPSGRISKTIFVSILRLLAGALLMLVASTAANLVQRSIEMSGLGISSLFNVLPTVIFRSHYGSIWMIRVAAIILLFVLLYQGRRHQGSRFFGVLLLLSGAVIAFSRSAAGHAADYGSLSPELFADWIHLLSVSFLAGPMFVFVILYITDRSDSHEELNNLLSLIGESFYKTVGPVLAIIVFTGMYTARSTVGNFHNLVTTSYGRLLLLKLTGLVLLSLRLIAPPQYASASRDYANNLIRRSKTDALILIAILLAVSVIVHTIPALHEAHLASLKKHSPDSEESRQPTLAISTSPSRVVAGIPVQISVKITGKDGKPFQGLMLSHERILHAIIISKDLGFFAHIHPEDLGPVSRSMLTDAVLPLRFTFPRPGEYLIGFDFAADDESYSKTVPVRVAAAEAMTSPKIDLALTKTFGEYGVNLKIPADGVRSETDTKLRFYFTRNGKEVMDLEPYLGAAMHLAIVPLGLDSFMHAHGVIPGEEVNHHDHIHSAPPPKFGPEIDADMNFPTKGIFKIFAQVQHKGKILSIDFMIDVK